MPNDPVASGSVSPITNRVNGVWNTAAPTSSSVMMIPIRNFGLVRQIWRMAIVGLLQP